MNKLFILSIHLFIGVNLFYGRRKGKTMNGIEYLEACKTKCKVDTNYKLAKHLEIPQSEMTFYARGERVPSLYACYKMAECLGIDPALIMADIASETEKNPKKREFFKSFTSTCKKAVAGANMKTAWLIFTLGATATAIYEPLRIMFRYVSRKKV